MLRFVNPSCGMDPPKTLPMFSWAIRPGGEDKDERNLLEASSLVAGKRRCVARPVRAHARKKARVGRVSRA